MREAEALEKPGEVVMVVWLVTVLLALRQAHLTFGVEWSEPGVCPHS